MTRLVRTAALALGLSAGTVPAIAADPAQPLIDADRAFAQRAKEVGVGAAFKEYAADVSIYPSAPGFTMTPDDWTRAFPPGSTLEWEPVGGSMDAAGTMGMTWGKGLLRGTGADGKPFELRTHYLTVWQKQPDGSWKFVADTGVPEPKPPATKP